MQGTRRRQYVDIVEEGNAADGAPQRGAGAPVSGDATAQVRMRAVVIVARSVRFGVALTRKRAGTAPPSAARPGRNPVGDGAIWAHFVVGRS